MEYGDINAVRRGTQLILNSERNPRFSALNILAFGLLVTLVIAGFRSLFV